MLITIICWLCLFIILELLSKTFLKIVNVSINSDDFFLVRQYIGLNVLAVSLLIASIFSKIDGVTLPIIFLLSVYLNRQKLSRWIKDFSDSWRINQLITIFTILAIHSAYSNQAIYLGDTGGYHFGFIKWLSQFGVLPGLAHLEPRFGFGSSWLTLTALFNHDFLEGRSGALINGYLFLCCSLQIYIFKKNKSFDIATIFLIISLILTIPYSLRSGVVLSPSPDFPIHLLGSLASFIILKKTTNQVNLLLLLSSMTFNVKLSSLPLLIWASLRKIEIQFKFGTIFFIAGFLIIPICVVNFITSGYPLYPSTLIQINSDWTLSLNAVQQIKNDIFRYAAFTPNYWLEPDYATTPIIKKIYLWSTSKYEFITFSLIIGSIASFLYLRKITPSQNQKNISMISLLSLIGIVFFIATAPTIRFGIQWLIILPSLSIAYIIHTYRYSAKKIHLFTSCVTPFLALIFLVSPVANTQKLIYSAIDKKTIQFDGNSSLNFLTPPPLPNVVTEDDSINKVAYRIRPLIYETNKEGINIAQGPQCWNTPIPCATMMNFQIFTPKRWHKSGYKQKEQAD